MADTLDAVEGLWLASLENNCEIFLWAAHYADQCAGDGLRPNGSGRVLPGTERSVQLGGVGTPRVAEFAASAFGARLRMGTLGGKAMIADALDTRHRLPACWARVQAYEARVPWVRYVARRTRELSVEAAAMIDAEMAESADGRVPWSRFCAKFEGLLVAADPDAAVARERARREEVFARTTRGSEHGIKGFYLRGPAALVIRLDATVTFLAEALKALGDRDDEDHRRVKALAILANPMQAVELLAAFAAHRTRTGEPADPDGGIPDDELPFDHDADGTAGGTAGAGDGPDDRDPDRDADPAAGGDVRVADGGDPDKADAPEVDGSDDEATDAVTGAAASDAGGPGVPVPRAFRLTDLPGWLARACDPESRWRLDWPRLLPRVHLFIHIAKETLDPAPAPHGENDKGGRGETRGGVARWEGEGPITREYLREQLAPYHDFTHHPGPRPRRPGTRRRLRIPRRHRQAVRLRTPADCFPFAANLDPVDLDHTRAYQHTPEPGQQQPPPGQSRMDNYSPLGRFHHRVKTHGHWQVRQPFAGIYVWRDPFGAYYLVDHTGTRKTSPPRRTPPTRPTAQKRRDAKPLVVAIHHTDTIVELDFDAA